MHQGQQRSHSKVNTTKICVQLLVNMNENVFVYELSIGEFEKLEQAIDTSEMKKTNTDSLPASTHEAWIVPEPFTTIPVSTIPAHERSYVGELKDVKHENQTPTENKDCILVPERMTTHDDYEGWFR